MTWKEYIQKTRNKKPHKLIMEAASLIESGRALDLGAGSLGDAKYLASRGFEVTAVDSERSVIDLAKGVANLRVVVDTMEHFTPEGTYDLVNAQYALPFVPKTSFWKVVAMSAGCLREGGIYCASFFGTEDEWRNDSKITFVSKDELIERLVLSSLDISHIEEEKGYDKTAAGPSKFWHVFHVIARKRG